MTAGQASRGLLIALLACAVVGGSGFASAGTITVDKRKIVPDVDKPRSIEVIGNTWRIKLDPKYELTCGQAGLTNKLWAAGYRWGPKTWDAEKNITAFQPADTKEKMYEQILEWLGKVDDGRYGAIGLLVQGKRGGDYIRELKNLKPGSVKLSSYQRFSYVVGTEDFPVAGKPHKALSDDQLKDAARYFKDCQFLELCPQHVVSVAAIRISLDPTGKPTGGSVTVHDSDSDVVNDAVWPPVFAGDDETYDLVKKGTGWAIRFDPNDHSKDAPIISYKVFCPESYKKGKALGGKGNPHITYDPGLKQLSFSDSAVNILDSIGGVSGGIEAQYAGDPILDATISISPVTMIEPWDEGFDPSEYLALGPGQSLYSDGYVFSSGTLTVKDSGGRPLIEARFGYFRILLEATSDASDNFGVLTDYTISNHIGSPFLADLEAQWADPTAVMDFYVEVPGYANLAEAFAGFSVGQITTHEAAYALAENGKIPEPMTMLALALGVGGLGGYLRRRRSQCGLRSQPE